jgi:hypothetical protein
MNVVCETEIAHQVLIIVAFGLISSNLLSLVKISLPSEVAFCLAFQTPEWIVSRRRCTFAV